MKKKILSAAIILTALVGFNASAQSATSGVEKVKTEKTCKAADKKDCKKADGDAVKGDCKKDCGKCDKKGTKDCKKARKDGKKGDFGKQQGMRQHGSKRHGGHEQLFKGIQLNDIQKDQLQALRAKKRDRKGDARSKGELDQAQRQQMREARHAEFVAQVKGILTPDQFKTFESNLQERKSKRRS